MSGSKKNEKIVCFLTLAYMVPFAVLIIINMICSLFQTTYMELYQDVEKPLYKPDHPIFLLLMLALFLGIGIISFKHCKVSDQTVQILEKTTLVFSAVISLFIIFVYRVNVACDSKFLSNIAVSFLNGDFSSFSGDEYLVHYPHQVGMIALLEAVYYIFGVENFTTMQFLNVIAIFSVIYFLHRITEEMFHNDHIQVLLSVLCMGMLPLYLYATFIYGDIPGMGFVMPAIYMIIKYLNSGKKRLIFPAALCMMMAVILKSNNATILAAAVIILILYAVREKKLFPVIFAVALVMTPWMGNKMIDAYYVHVSGMEAMPAGIPKIAWVAMGLQKNDYLENGWYNSYNWSIYTDCDYDAAKTTQACMESVKESLQSFAQHPKSAVKFFYKKFISQWNDPGFQSQITNEWYSRHREDHSALALSLIYGKGRIVLEWIMNIYHFLILFGTSVFVMRSIKKWSLPAAFLTLCVFGGYFFHMFWEAGGRYGLGYFVMCVPFAAGGLWFIMQKLTNILYRDTIK